MTYLTTTFSPSMLSSGVTATVQEITEEKFASYLKVEYVPAVGHENTAVLLQKKFGLANVPFARVNITLNAGDVVLAAIPQFRLPETREFTDNEIASAKFRYFLIIAGE